MSEIYSLMQNQTPSINSENKELFQNDINAEKHEPKTNTTLNGCLSLNKIQQNQSQGEIDQNMDKNFKEISLLNNKHLQIQNSQKQQKSNQVSFKQIKINLNTNHQPKSFNKQSTVKQNDKLNNQKEESKQKDGQSAKDYISTNALVKFILQRNKKKVIQHKINVINPELVLYKKIRDSYPSKRKIKTQADEQNNKQFADSYSTQKQKINKCGKKLNEVYNKIKEQFKSLDELNKKSQSYQSSKLLTQNSFNAKQISNKFQKNEKYLSKGSSINLKTQTSKQSEAKRLKRNSKLLAVSGIVTYKFKSLKAQKRLIYNELNKGQNQLDAQLSQIDKRKNCPLDRENRIQYRSVSGNKNKQMKQKQIALKQSFTKLQYQNLQLEQYLKLIEKNTKKVSRIYGEEENKLEYINYLMYHENLDRPLAQFSVDFIVQKIKKDAQNKKGNISYSKSEIYKRKVNLDDEQQLNSRKKICYKPRRNNLIEKKASKTSKTSKTSKNSIRKINPNNPSAIMLSHLTFVNDYQ